MDQIAAFDDTLKLIEEKSKTNGSLVWEEGPPECSIEHLKDMLVRIREAEYTGNKFSQSKKGRWLGYAQGVACALGWLSLEECKQINLKHA